MDKEDKEINSLEVRDRGMKSAQQAPRQSHQPISCESIDRTNSKQG